MNKSLFALSFALFMYLPVALAANTGEKQMATLIFEEDFSGNTVAEYQGNGWYDGVGNIGRGYKLEHDPTLNKQVLYAHWTNGNASGDPNHPDGNTTALRLSLPPERTENGVTLHMAFKTRNMLETSGSRGQAGAHAFRFMQNIGQYGPANAEWQVNLIELGGLGREAGLNMPDGSIDWSPQNASQTIYFRSGSNVLARFAGPVGILRDEVWYEVRAHVKVDSTAGGANTRLIVDYREWGSSNWTRIMDKTGYPMTNHGGNINQFMIGPYTERWVDDIRLYAGFIRIYEGDAISDGTIGDDTGGDPEPTPEPVALEIQNFEVSGGHDQATISWDTNLPANAVLDYGVDEDRGTVLRSGQFGEHHTFLLENLTPETTYYFRYSSRTEDGDSVFDPENSTFTTDAVPVEPEPEPEGFMIVLEHEPKAGEGVMFDGEKWVCIDLKAEVKRILETEVKLIVS